MARMIKPTFGPLFKLLLAVFVILGLVAGSAAPAFAQSMVGKRTAGRAYHDEWRKLWEDHITWTRIVILGILDGLPGNNAYVNRLLQNPADMADSLRPYYGDQADVFGNLVKDHLAIAAEMLTDAHAGNMTGFNDAKTRWYANADQLAAQMYKMNPRAWPLDETKKMWTDHLDATLLEATSNLSGDYAGEVAAYDHIHSMGLEMADFISSGVVQQFPRAFKGSPNH